MAEIPLRLTADVHMYTTTATHDCDRLGEYEPEVASFAPLTPPGEHSLRSFPFLSATLSLLSLTDRCSPR